MSISIEVEGLEEFQRQLADAQGAVRDELEDELEDLAEDAATDAAVSAPKVTGELASGYKAQVLNSGAPDIRVKVLNDEPHAAGAEFGKYGKWKGFRKYGRRGHRFLMPAVKEARQDAALRALEAVQRGLDKAD